MELEVQKLISTSRQVDFVAQTLIVTSDVMAFKSNSSGEIDDAIPLNEVEHTEVIANDCRREGGWDVIEGILAGESCS